MKRILPLATFLVLLVTAAGTHGVAGGATPKADQSVTITAGRDWLPLDVNLDIEPGSALDFSALVPRHAPAGKFGRVVATRQGKFAFERRATPMRFYGVDLCCTAQFLPHALADRLADRLVRLGYNTVRIHHYERDLLERTPDALRLRADTLDQLDYLFAALKRRGIYVTTDLYVSRVVAVSEVYPAQPAQGPNPQWTFENYYRVGPGSFDVQQFKLAVMINERAYANYKAFARTLLEHRNPYTGLRYADDPALGWLSVMNEDCPGNAVGGLRGPLRDEWQRAWNRWLVARCPDQASLDRTLGRLPEGQNPARGTVPLPSLRVHGPATVAFNAFLAEVEQAFFTRTRKFLRDELHCPALLTDCNGWTNTVQLQASRDAFDYVDDHFYVDHPSFLNQVREPPSRSANTNSVAGGAAGGRACAFSRVFGKPFTVTEFNYCGPGEFRGVGGMLCGALAAVQDWDGVWRHVYAYNREEIERPARLSYFNLAADPLNLAADRAALCLFLRGDLPPARHAVAITAAPGALLRSAQTSCDKTPAWDGLAWLTRVGWRFDGRPQADELPIAFSGRDASPFTLDAGLPLLDALRQRAWLPAGNRSDFRQNRFQSADGAVAIDAAAKVLSLDTTRTAGGFAAAGGRIATRAVTIDVMDADATVWVSSLDSQPIVSSRRLLVSHLTDLQNSGTRYGDRQRQLLVDWGRLPHLVRAGRANLMLRLDHPEQVKVYGLAVNGRRVGELPATAVGGALSVPLSVSAAGKARMLYEVTIGR